MINNVIEINKSNIKDLDVIENPKGPDLVLIEVGEYTSRLASDVPVEIYKRLQSQASFENFALLAKTDEGLKRVEVYPFLRQRVFPLTSKLNNIEAEANTITA